MSDPSGPELQIGSEGNVTRVRPGACVTIGRGTECDLILADLRVSRQHLAVEFADGEGWVARDLGSSAGTYREAERVSRCVVDGEVLLHLGDAISGPTIRLQTVGTARANGDVSPAVVRVGRAQDNAIVLPELLVSRHHAEFRQLGDGFWAVSDSGSRGGTFVGGRRVTQEIVGAGQEVLIGHYALRLSNAGVQIAGQHRPSTLEAKGASAILSGGQKILDEVSFLLTGGTFLALLGPTGSGKSTLLKTLTGFRPPEAGEIRVNGLDLYGSSAELRQLIGYVPQDDILHPQLTPRKALGFAAELRFPPDVSREERNQRVEEVMIELGLSARADVAIERLSGGQRKRTSVAIELLTKPSLLLLDEPTSGLDPGYEKAVMEQLRQLARGGRIVVVVTHSVQSLDLCHKVLFLAPGGKVAFFGPPAEALEFFGRSRYASVFQELEASSPDKWKRRQAAKSLDSVGEVRRDSDGPAPSLVAPVAWRNQVSTLCRRQVAVLLADRRNLAYLLAEVLIPALLILALVGKRSFEPTVADNPNGLRTLLGALAVSAAAVGAANSVREIVKELPLYFRERAVGLSRSAYVVSKAIVLGGLTAFQVAILVLIATRGAAGPTTSDWLGSPMFELILDIALGGIAAMCLGLLISTMVSSSEKAMALIPVVFIVMWLFSGMAVNLQNSPLMRTLGYLTSANWSLSMAASSSKLYEVQDRALSLQGLPVTTATTGQQASVPRDARWNFGIGNWMVGAMALASLSAVTLALADRVLARKEPFTRRQCWHGRDHRQAISEGVA